MNQSQGTEQKNTERHLVEQPVPINAAQAPPSIQPKPLQGPIFGGDPSGALSAKDQYLRNSVIPLQTPEAVITVARPQEAQATKAQEQQHPSEQQAPIVGGDPANADDEEVDPLDVLMEEMQKILAGGKILLKENQVEYQRETQEGHQPQQQRQLWDDYDLSHHRLDPGHHNSQRAGPDVPRPYLPRQ
jgi:hypothetical protein